jgi:hypothetical protein
MAGLTLSVEKRRDSGLVGTITVILTLVGKDGTPSKKNKI